MLARGADGVAIFQLLVEQIDETPARVRRDASRQQRRIMDSSKQCDDSFGIAPREVDAIVARSA